MIFPTVLTAGAPVSRELLAEAETLGDPLVVKECFGSLGQQVYLVRGRKELEEISAKLQGVPYLYQEFIAESRGKDLRVLVVGGKAIAGMRRTSRQDFRSNAELGGKGEPCALDDEARTLAEAAAEKIGLDYCGVDLLFGKAGYLVCEVNSNAFFGTLEKVTGVNVAATYAEHILKEIYKNAV